VRIPIFCGNGRWLMELSASVTPWVQHRGMSETEPAIMALDFRVEERIVSELGPQAGGQVLRCLRTAESLLHYSAEDEDDLRYAESAAYNLREALDSVVQDRKAGNSGFAAAMEAWEHYRIASQLAGADEPAARATAMKAQLLVAPILGAGPNWGTNPTAGCVSARVLTTPHDTSRRSAHSRSTNPPDTSVSPGQRVLTTSFATRGSRVQIPSAPPLALVKGVSRPACWS
jgi:hypothetical protein